MANINQAKEELEEKYDFSEYEEALDRLREELYEESHQEHQVNQSTKEKKIAKGASPIHLKEHVAPTSFDDSLFKAMESNSPKNRSPKNISTEDRRVSKKKSTKVLNLIQVQSSFADIKEREQANINKYNEATSLTDIQEKDVRHRSRKESKNSYAANSHRSMASRKNSNITSRINDGKNRQHKSNSDTNIQTNWFQIFDKGKNFRFYFPRNNMRNVLMKLNSKINHHDFSNPAGRRDAKFGDLFLFPKVKPKNEKNKQRRISFFSKK